MAENQANRGDRDAADPFETIERLTPSPAMAIAGMRPAYLDAFRGAAGPGSGDLALLAWKAWSTCLMDGSGLRTASRRAENAATGSIRRHVRRVARIWITSDHVRAAARYASRIAASSR